MTNSLNQHEDLAPIKHKKTLVLGASPNPSRVSYQAIFRLRKNDHEVIALGLREGEVDGVSIDTKAKFYNDVHTVTLYLGEHNQVPYYQYIIALNPKRIVFNPGAENDELAKLAIKNGIEVLEACTLVMLSIGNY